MTIIIFYTIALLSLTGGLILIFMLTEKDNLLLEKSILLDEIQTMIDNGVNKQIILNKIKTLKEMKIK